MRSLTPTKLASTKLGSRQWTQRSGLNLANASEEATELLLGHVLGQVVDDEIGLAVIIRAAGLHGRRAAAAVAGGSIGRARVWPVCHLRLHVADYLQTKVELKDVAFEIRAVHRFPTNQSLLSPALELRQVCLTPLSLCRSLWEGGRFSLPVFCVGSPSQWDTSSRALSDQLCPQAPDGNMREFGPLPAPAGFREHYGCGNPNVIAVPTYLQALLASACGEEHVHWDISTAEEEEKVARQRAVSGRESGHSSSEVVHKVVCREDPSKESDAGRSRLGEMQINYTSSQRAFVSSYTNISR
ncbi:hypothetical protein DNTS_025680 [Danionella cerebrum]|uniref:Uncharacterized protein n=1 Tax=Danionella cerebrum TaxID=2873325 RepID=A0A553QFG2_9TELE|nr:hypothetical protein DNTS_025680 [Danionella translucida]